MPSNQQEQEYESRLNQDKAQVKKGGVKSVLTRTARSIPKMDMVDLMLGLFVAGLFDLLSFIPTIGNLISVIGVGLFTMVFWFKGIRMKKLAGGALIALIIEGIPFISWLPAVMFFVARTYLREQVSARLPVKVASK